MTDGTFLEDVLKGVLSVEVTLIVRHKALVCLVILLSPDSIVTCSVIIGTIFIVSLVGLVGLIGLIRDKLICCPLLLRAIPSLGGRAEVDVIVAVGLASVAPPDLTEAALTIRLRRSVVPGGIIYLLGGVAVVRRLNGGGDGRGSRRRRCRPDLIDTIDILGRAIGILAQELAKEAPPAKDLLLG